jgi:type IV fimbrial biogenesis protein FimT
MATSTLPARAQPAFSARGFTLIELLVIVALIAILSALAAPSFTGMFERYRVDTTREAMIATIQQARAEAIRQGQVVILERATTNCSPALSAAATDWSCGWIMYADLNKNSTRDAASEPVIQAIEQPRRVNVANNAGSRITINNFGQIGSFGSFSFSPTNGNASNAQVICISSGSRIRTAKGTTTCP